MGNPKVKDVILDFTGGEGEDGMKFKVLLLDAFKIGRAILDRFTWE